MSDPILEVLAGVVGAEGLLSQDDASGWGASERAPRAVVCPGSTEETAAVLALASREGWTVVPAGLGSWLGGGNPVDADVVLTTRRMRGMVEYEPADVTLTAEAGLPLVELENLTGAHGQWLPLDPPGARSGSLGAMVSTGVAGPLRQSYGTPRDHVLGLTLVTGDGRVLRLGGRVVKNVAGFDLTRLSIGSWGTLGVVLTVSIRLFPLPQRDVSIVAGGASWGEVHEAGRTLAQSSLSFGALELLEGVEGLGGGGAGPSFLVRLLGSTPEVEEMERRVREMVHGLSVQRFEDPDSRDLHNSLTKVEEEAGLVLRMTLLPSRLERGRGFLEEHLAGPGMGTGGVRIATHLGSGVTRVIVPLPEGKQDEVKMPLAQGVLALREAVEREGGSVTVSSGPPDVVREVGAWGAPGALAGIQRDLKREFDPAGILSPGRFVV
jgi:glycolate oxidase FAD binding subunit